MALPDESRAADFGKPASFGRSSESIFPANPNTPFFLWHHPHAEGNWQVETEGLDGPTWLPILSRVHVIPGVNGHRTREANDPQDEAYSHAHHTLQRKGSIQIPRDAGGIDDYLRERPCSGPSGRKGHYYHDAFEVPQTPLAGRRVKCKRDRAAWNQWRMQLVLDGVVPPPHPDIVGLRLGAERRRFQSAEGRNYASDDVREREVGAARARLAMYEEAIVPEPGEAKPKAATPPTKKAPAKKAPAKKATTKSEAPAADADGKGEA